MIKLIFAFIAVVHAAIHLLGFVKAYGIADVPQLRHPIPKAFGILWLGAAILIAAAAAAFLLHVEWWWFIAMASVAVSQWLIITSWHDAKFGTAINVLILIIAVVGYGGWEFTRTVNAERDIFLAHRDTGRTAVTRDMLASFPPLVQRWLEHSGVLGKETIRTVHLLQKGMMRTSKEGKWMPVEAEQWFTTRTPGFFWTAEVSMLPGVTIAARDKYEDGHGSMLIKALSLIPVADARGKEIDQGTMVRYLAELVWFPTAALEPYLHWEQVDSMTARATMTYGGISASGTYTFTPEGDIASFEAKRYYDRKEGATLEDWHIENEPDGYREFGGVRIAARSTVTWRLKDGEFTWLKLELTNVEYNAAQ